LPVELIAQPLTQQKHLLGVAVLILLAAAFARMLDQGGGFCGPGVKREVPTTRKTWCSPCGDNKSIDFSRTDQMLDAMRLSMLLLIAMLAGLLAAREAQAQRRGQKGGRGGRAAPAQTPAQPPAQPPPKPATPSDQPVIAQTRFKDLAVDSTFFFLSDTNRDYPWKKISATSAQNTVNSNVAAISAQTPVTQ